MLLVPGSPEIQRIDAALADWRQGDLALDELWFTYVSDATNALTRESAEAGEGLQAITVGVEGLIIVTQSCDIVRSCSIRPFIEVSPLVEVPALAMPEITRGRRPAYASVPAVKDRCLVADLDRVMTVEKAVVASWKRTEGCGTDQERRAFARALVRKRARAAFPEDFVRIAAKFIGHLQGKHDKDTGEGRALRALREIRVRAAPSWHADQVEVIFWYIPESDDLHFEGCDWNKYLDAWCQLIVPTGRFTRIHGVVRPLEDLTARDYVESDPLDLDYLSTHNDFARLLPSHPFPNRPMSV